MGPQIRRTIWEPVCRGQEICGHPSTRQIAFSRQRVRFRAKCGCMFRPENDGEGSAPMLRDKFNAALKEAMLSKDQRRVSTVRLILAGLKEKDIEARGAGREKATEDEILGLLQKMIKQRAESIETYDKHGRPELAAQEREEKAIIESYLPAQMSADEVRAAIKAIVAATGASSVKDMGKVMAELKAKFAGKMDFSKANGVVKEILTQ